MYEALEGESESLLRYEAMAAECMFDPDANAEIEVVGTCCAHRTPGLLGKRLTPPVLLVFQPALPMIWLIGQYQSRWP